MYAFGKHDLAFLPSRDYIPLTLDVMFVQESEGAIVSFAASAKRHRPIKSEYNDYIGLLQG